MNNNNILRNFLVYSYFNIVPEAIYKESFFKTQYGDDYKVYCLKKVIMVAYRDATNQGAYNALFKNHTDKDDPLKEKSNKARRESAKLLFEEIGKRHMKQEDQDFNAWHTHVCAKLIEKHKAVEQNGKAFFSYGNAQKWVNMTLKYLWLLGLLEPNIDPNKLHIPVDSLIINALWSHQEVTLPSKEDNPLNRGKTYAYPSDRVKGWSQWEEEEYSAFRTSLPEEFSLDWENDAWIEQSEKRKRHDSRKRYEEFWP